MRWDGFYDVETLSELLAGPWRVTRASAVGGALVLLLAARSAVAVYLNRDEDAIAVDNLLAEDITREIGTAEQRGEDVDLAEVTDFEWDEVLIAERDATRAEISRAARRAVDGRPRSSAPATC